MKNTKQELPPKMLGIIGGMGPVASAEFLRTIYELNPAEREQDSPAVILYSNPSFPDRTEAFRSGDDKALLEELNRAIGQLITMGASKIVLCCLTVHYLLPKLPPSTTTRIISLLDVIFEEMNRRRERHLLTCSLGAREQRLFENHPQWSRLREYFVLLDQDDQYRLHHDFIYKLKRGCKLTEMLPFFESLLDKYNVAGFIAGCTEMHLMAKYYLSSIDQHQIYGCVDPLTIIARGLAERGAREGGVESIAWQTNGYDG